MAADVRRSSKLVCRKTFVPRATSIERLRSCAFLAVGSRENARLTRNDERLRHECANRAGSAGAWNIESLQRRMIANVIRRLAVRNLPEDFAFIEIDGADAAIRRLHQR